MNTLPRLFIIYPQVVLIKSYEVLMFQIHMYMPLWRAKTGVKEVAKRTGRGFGAQQGNVHMNLKH